MKVARVLGILLMAATAYGAEVKVDLAVEDSATPRTYAVDPGSFDIKLMYAIPNKTYDVVNDKRPKALDLGAAAPKPTCSPTKANAKAIYDLLLKKRKDADDKVTELSEVELKADLKTVDCSALLAAAKTQYDTDKTAFDATTDKPDAEKKRLEAVKAELDAAVKKTDALSEVFFVAYDYGLDKGETLQKTFKAADTTWPVVVTTQGGSAATTAAAAEKAANPVAAESQILNRLLTTTASHPDLILGTCKYTDLTPCTAKIYINADQISTLTVTDIPAGKVTVRVTGGEVFDECSALSYNIATYEKAPDKLIFPLIMRRSIGNFFGTVLGTHTERAKRFYFGDKKAGCPASAADDIRTKAPFKVPPIPSLPLYLQGKSEVMMVEFDHADGTHKSFEVPIVYQRFWLDAGGFFAFTRRSDQTLDLATIPATPANGNTPATPEMRKVVGIHREISVEAASGIVINVHPGNYPYLAFQFGIAANQGKLPSYYGGIGLRAREIGKRGLATLAVGVAMQQEQRYPNLGVNQQYDPTSDLLKGKAKYGLTFPYISISLGFSFGGVSEKTNVADSVTAEAR
jgi:hypothetical protein